MSDAGDRIGRWILETRLGTGAFGTAWRARDIDGGLGALKTLDAPPGDELRALARVCHPAVVAVLDGGGQPAPFLVMELAHGRPLGELVGSLDVDGAISVVANLADALATVHQAGLTHGDVKPDNIIVSAVVGGARPDVKLVDFGLAGGVIGGTLTYGAPEAAAGQSSGPPADVYALGLVLWELLHGALPWQDLDVGSALLQRRHEAPTPTEGPDWIKELLGAMLAVAAGTRPSAAEVADTLALHGAELHRPSGALVRRRARAVRIDRPTVSEPVDRWLRHGGRLSVVGPRGSGRSQVIAGVVDELRAQGRRWVRLLGTETPWAGVERALADPAIEAPPVGLPGERDPGPRARAAAVALEDRGIEVVVVDDHEDLDPGTALVLGEVARRGRISVCASGRGALADASAVAVLAPLARDGVASLVSSVLGTDEAPDALVERIFSVSGGLPGPAVELLVAAVEAGALVLRAGRWLVDAAQLGGLEVAQQVDRPLTTAGRRLGAVLSAHGLPLAKPVAIDLAGLDRATGDRAVHELTSAGLVALEAGSLRPMGRAAAATLRTGATDLPGIHGALARRLLAEVPVPFARLGRHIVGAADADLAAAWGASSILALRRLDPAEAARLADALWKVAPVPDVASARIEALVSAGRADEAVRLGDEIVAAGDPAMPVLLALARVHTHFTGDDAAAGRAIATARTMVGAGSQVPLELVDVEANRHLRARRFADAIAVAATVGERPPPADPRQLEIWLTLNGIWAQAVQQRDGVDEAIAILERIPEELGDGTPSRALLEAMRGRLLWHAGRLREASRAMAKASAGASGLPAVERARMLNNAALADYQVGDLAGALASWEQAAMLFERMESLAGAVVVRANLCVAYRQAGRWERALRAGHWAAEKAAELELAEQEGMAWGNLGDVHLIRGEYDRAAEMFERAGALLAGLEPTEVHVELARRRAELAILTGASLGLELARTAEAMALEVGVPFEACRARALAAVALARSGQFAEVDALIEQAVTPLADAGAAAELAEVRLWVAEALFAAGRTEEALERASRVVAYADEVGHAHLRTRADKLLARGGPRAVVDDRLEHLLDLAVAVARERDLSSLLDRIAQAALDLLEADRAFVLLVNDRGVPWVAAARTRHGERPGQPSMTVVRRALSGRKEVIAADLGERGDLRISASVNQLELRSAMCLPMLDERTVIGVVYVDSRSASEQELMGASALLRALAAHAAVAVSNARHLAAAHERAARAAELAHDIANPASVLAAIADEVLSDHLTPADLREIGHDLAELGARLAAMGDGFLEGREPTQYRIDLGALTRSVGMRLARIARKRGIVLEIPGASEEAPVIGVPHELERVLGNLVSNAFKHTPRGGTVAVRLEEDAINVGWVVRDQGPGIAAEILGNLFESGVQAPGAELGRGLGLAIARRIVAEHGGTIEAGNHPQGGATFRVMLPRAP